MESSTRVEKIIINNESFQKDIIDFTNFKLRSSKEELGMKVRYMDGSGKELNFSTATEAMHMMYCLLESYYGFFFNGNVEIEIKTKINNK